MDTNTPTPITGHSCPDILTPSEAAKLLRVSRRHLQKLVADGAIPAPLTISPRILRWKRDDLLAALAL
ncbi:MAG: helix-turn-helix transcriptional regulator [Macromonas sp.]